MRRLVRLVGAAAISSTLLVVLPGAARAECDGPIPDFRDVVRSATRVFIGDVTVVENPGPDGFGSRFTVRVRYVLRGRVHRWPMEIRDLQGSPCSPMITATKGEHGERIALALDGTARVGGDEARVNSIAYITGDAPASWTGSDPHIRADEIYRLAGVPLDTRGYAVDPPNTATGEARMEGVPARLALLLTVFVCALVLSLRRGTTARGTARRRLP